MKLEIKYNKTVLREFQTRLKMRERALPTLKNKEAALISMVFETRRELEKARMLLETVVKQMEPWQNLLNEFDFSLLRVTKIDVTYNKIAGTLVPRFEGVETVSPDFAFTAFPDWFSEGIPELRKLLEAEAARKVMAERLALLEQARKKATQKVNLYEKVQIPALETAIRQINRHLEDEENLSKASQKLLKSSLERSVKA